MAKTIFITGASSGIGRATAKHFSEIGWNVAATMRHPEKETELQELPNVKLYKLDVTDKDQVRAARDAAIADFNKIDVVMNNAGYAVTGYFEDMTEEQIRAMYDVNVFGLMDVTRAFLPHFRENKGGTFVNLSSVGGVASFPGVHLYNSTKFAVEGFSEGVSYELGQFGIRTIIIEPGSIETDFQRRSQIRVPNVIDNYKAVTEKQMSVMYQSGREGTNYLKPQVIAELVETALNDNSEKTRYPSEDAKQMIDMRSNLGADGFMRQINKMFYGE